MRIPPRFFLNKKKQHHDSQQNIADIGMNIPLLNPSQFIKKRQHRTHNNALHIVFGNIVDLAGVMGFNREYTPDAWVKKGATKIGYEVSFTRHFYQPPQLRTLAQISSDILALEQETEGLLSEITKGATA